jgi:hypothetical protein
LLASPEYFYTHNVIMAESKAQVIWNVSQAFLESIKEDILFFDSSSVQKDNCILRNSKIPAVTFAIIILLHLTLRIWRFTYLAATFGRIWF